MGAYGAGTYGWGVYGIGGTPPAPAPPPRDGIGLLLDFGTSTDVVPPLDTLAETVPLRIIAPTVPKPTLVDGRPT